MTTLQTIATVLLLLLLAAISAWQIVKIVYAIKSKGETLKPKGEGDKQNKEEGGKEE